MRRHHQRARAGGRRVVDVRAGADEPLRRLHVAVTGREQQRRVAPPVPYDALVVLRAVGGVRVHHAGPDSGPGAQVGAVRQQHVDDLVVSLGHRPHQRGLSAGAFVRVDVGAMRRQQPDGVRVAGAGSRHDRRLAVAQRDVGVGAGVEQARHHAGAAVAGGEPERRRSQLVGGVDVGAGVDQQRGDLVVVPIGRPMQRGGAVGLCRVDVGAGVEERPDRAGVLGARRIDEGRCVDAVGRRAVDGGRRDAQRQQGQQTRRRQTAESNPFRCHLWPSPGWPACGRPQPSRHARVEADRRWYRSRMTIDNARSCGQTYRVPVPLLL